MGCTRWPPAKMTTLSLTCRTKDGHWKTLTLVDLIVDRRVALSNGSQAPLTRACPISPTLYRQHTHKEVFLDSENEFKSAKMGI